MTESDWLSCKSPEPMLIFLRGKIATGTAHLTPRFCSTYGNHYAGAGEQITALQCGLFILRCARRLFEFDIDKPSREALASFERYVIDREPHDEFVSACKRIHEYTLSGGHPLVSHMAACWIDDPAGAALAAVEIAWTIAYQRARDTVAIAWEKASEDDRSGWGFSGPPDPGWLDALHEEEMYQAAELRDIVGNPFRDASCRRTSPCT